MEVDQASREEGREAVPAEATSPLGAFWEVEVVEEVKTISREVEARVEWLGLAGPHPEGGPLKEQDFVEEAQQVGALAVKAVVAVAEDPQVDALEEVVVEAGFAEERHCPWNPLALLPPLRSEPLLDVPPVAALEVVEGVAIVLEATINPPQTLSNSRIDMYELIQITEQVWYKL